MDDTPATITDIAATSEPQPQTQPPADPMTVGDDAANLDTDKSVKVEDKDKDKVDDAASASSSDDQFDDDDDGDGDGDGAFDDKDKKSERASSSRSKNPTDDDSTGDLDSTTENRKQALEALRREEDSQLGVERGNGVERLKFLLQKSELFNHFMAPKVPKPSVRGRPGKGAGRHGTSRLTEKEEDDELLQMAATGTAFTRLTKQPPSVTGVMRAYQLEGLNWLISLYHNGINGILADEMGLGKTLQTISVFGYLRSFQNINGPHLVIVPKSTLGNWIRELGHWAPEISAKRFHGSKDERPAIKEGLKTTGYDVLVTTYETAVAEKSFLGQIQFHYLVVDEAHRIKNEHSVLSRVIRTFTSKHRLLITGTPLQNNLHELWAMLNFIMPELFHSSEDFDDWFDTSKDVGRDVIEQLHKLLRPFLLRRLKADVEKDLPPKKEIRVFVTLAELQRHTYKNILERNISALNDVGANRVQLLNLVMQLRKCCNHPFLFDGIEQPPFVTDSRLVTTSGKMKVLDKLLPVLKANGDRVLIFSQMTRLLDILEDYVRWRGYTYCRLDGSTSGEERDRQMTEFNKPGSDMFIFMLSTRAGGLGINLYTANIVILYDSDWNPQADLQAMDRAHRIGQTKEVTVYRFICEQTVEEGVIRRAQKKLMLDQLVIQQGRLLDKAKPLSKEEMLAMVQRGAQQILNSTDGDGEFDVDLDAVLAKAVDRTAAEDEDMKAQFGDAANRVNFAFDGAGMYEFEGQDYKESDRERRDRLDVNYIALPKREHKKATYNDSAYFKQMLTQKGVSKPKMPRQPELYKFQFHNSARLDELRAKEMKCFQKGLELHARCEAANSWDRYEEQRKELEERDGLTASEKDEIQVLMEGGFGAWSKRDFYNFVKACERFGRHDLDNVCSHVEGKTLDEVKRYHKVFFDRYTEIEGYERILKNIERSEKNMERVEAVRLLLAERVGSHTKPEETLRLPAGVGAKRAGFIDDNDRFLLAKLHQLGYGHDSVYEEIQAQIRLNSAFRFDYYFKSRSVEDLKKRAEMLIRAMEKEKSEDKEKRKEDPKKRARPVTPTPSASSEPSVKRKKKDQ